MENKKISRIYCFVDIVPCLFQHIEADTKWPPFCRLELVPQGLINNNPTFGTLDNGLMPYYLTQWWHNWLTHIYDFVVCVTRPHWVDHGTYILRKPNLNFSAAGTVRLRTDHGLMVISVPAGVTGGKHSLATVLITTAGKSHHRFFWGPFYWRGLTLIPAWISDYIHHKVWDEITYPVTNFNGSTLKLGNK